MAILKLSILKHRQGIWVQIHVTWKPCNIPVNVSRGKIRKIRQIMCFWAKQLEPKFTVIKRDNRATSMMHHTSFHRYCHGNGFIQLMISICSWVCSHTQGRVCSDFWGWSLRCLISAHPNLLTIKSRPNPTVWDNPASFGPNKGLITARHLPALFF